ncbi:MAG: hypothetical protein GXO15_06220 [Crenarchaeota archaeon]|nr:hypothetical protein [Thermoproteota archaeon]
MIRRLLSFLRDLHSYADMLDAKEIARRMFVTNSFDGLLSTLGIVLGNYMYGTVKVESYVGSVVGASMALGFFSGMVATYMSERAERLRELRKTEKAVLRSLRGTIYEKAAKVVPVYVAFWSGVGAMLLPVIGIAPFLAAMILGLSMPVWVLVYASAGLILLELFLLGVYLGRISGENPLVSGARMTAIGMGAVALFTALRAF